MSITEHRRRIDEIERRNLKRLRNHDDPAYDRALSDLMAEPGDTPSLEQQLGAVPSVSRASEDDAVEHAERWDGLG